jgi:SAM-dependent methyltransferase
VERASRAGWGTAVRRARPGAIGLSDILAGQPAGEELLAAIYDFEHDEIVEDLAFYRRWTRRHPGAVLDFGCGSGRLFRSFLEGGATRVVGVDGSTSLAARAEARVEADELLRSARDEGRLEVAVGDVRHIRRRDRFALVVLAGVVAHLDGPEDAARAFASAAAVLEPGGVLIVDLLGPGGLPPHDLPLSLDWERAWGDRRVIRRSQLNRHETPEGLRVDYATLTDLVEADGTIARLPASFRLWYPSPSAIVALAGEAGLEVEAAFGSHDLEPLDERSERCIMVLRREADEPGVG